MYYLYILQNNTDKLYVGISKNPKNRLRLHNSGQGAKYTSNTQDFWIAYLEEFSTQQEAVKREKQLKGWSHKKKKSLVKNDTKRLKELSKSKS